MSDAHVTTLLVQAVGDTSAKDELYRLVEDELQAIAKKQLGNERPGHTLQATVLVNDAFMRLVGGGADIDWQGRSHFYRAAARAMRQMLIDHARAKQAKKRPPIDANIEVHQLAASMSAEELIMLNDALHRLAELDPRQGEVVELHIFSGHTLGEIGEMLGVSRSTVKGDWATAKAWLHREMTRGGTN